MFLRKNTLCLAYEMLAQLAIVGGIVYGASLMMKGDFVSAFGAMALGIVPTALKEYNEKSRLKEIVGEYQIPKLVPVKLQLMG